MSCLVGSARVVVSNRPYVLPQKETPSTYGQAPNRRALTVVVATLPSAVVVFRTPSEESPWYVWVLSMDLSPQDKEYDTVLPWILYDLTLQRPVAFFSA